MIKNYGCCDLEYAIKLKKLGVKQESLFYYRSNGKIGLGFNYDIVNGKMVWNTSTFTCAELGTRLPDYISKNHNILQLNILKIGISWVVSYRIGSDKFEIRVEAASEANAKAKMLIWLIENGEVKP